MTHVHYKFSSKRSYDTAVFDGPHVTLLDLKRQIMGMEKLRTGDLQITNAQTKEAYTDDECQIPKGSSVIVRRIPIIGNKSGTSNKTSNPEWPDVKIHHTHGGIKSMDGQSSSTALPFFSLTNLANADMSEEDKLKMVLHQSSFDTANYTSCASLPANYTCFRCGNAGHHIRNCPGDRNVEAPVRMKKSTGIPRSIMIEVDDPSVKGAMLTNDGRFVIPAIDAQAYAIGKKEKPPFVPQEKQESEEEEDPVPDELLCLICHDLLRYAVNIPCCGNSYCDECIRSALLDSEDHVCPTCNKSNVSPDTLTANNSLRQSVNNFKKNQGHGKSLSATQSQNPTSTPTSTTSNPAPLLPTPTPPTPTQPQKPYQTSHSQQDPLRAAESPPSSQVCLAPPTATDLTPASNRPSTSLQTEQSHLETSDKEADVRTHDDSAASAPSVPAAQEDTTAAPSQLIPLVDAAPVAEQPKTASVNLQQSSSASRRSGPSASWDSSTSSSACPPGAWNQSNTRHLPPSSSSSSTTTTSPYPPPPLFPSPHFHTFLPAQQPLGSYPLGYPTTPVWTIPTPPGAPIPSLCSSASTSSIPALIPKEWYRHQKKQERSPHRGSTYRRSSRSYSQSTKSKSSRSYSRSSSRSRSRSRSRSKGRSRPHSPYSRHRNPHSRSRYSSSYTYSYKRSRSPTPSSSSSPRVGHRSRSRSPSDHRKNSHHSRHHGRKSSSSSYSSSSRRRDRGEERSLPNIPQHTGQTSGLELDRERYLQWKREYEGWCEQYFSSYVSHFHQLPPPLLGLHPLPQWGDTGGGSNPSHSSSEPHKRHQGRRSPPSQSSSDSRSPPSHSSRSSRSTPSQSTSDSRFSPSRSSNESRSPPSQSSSDGRSTPSEDGAQSRTHKQRSSSQISLTKGDKEKQPKDEKLKSLSPLKNEQKSAKDPKERRRDESSTPDADSCYRKEERKSSIGARDGNTVQEEGGSCKDLESIQPHVKPDRHSDKNYERKRREQTDVEREKGWRRGKHSDSRREAERRHKGKSSKGEGRSDSDRYRNPEGGKASDSRSERDRKSRGEDVDGGATKAQSSKLPERKRAEDPETHKSKSPDLFDRKKQKVEKKKEKTLPPTQRDIWEGGIKVKPQRKISINIKLDGKWEEEKTEKTGLSFSEDTTGKTKEECEKSDTLDRGEMEININENSESSRNQEGVFGEKLKPNEGETRQLWEKATFRDDNGGETEKVSGDRKDGEDLNVWHCVLRGKEEEQEEISAQSDKRMEAHTRDEVTNEEKRNTWEIRELVAKEETTYKDNPGLGQREGEEELTEGGRWRMGREDGEKKRKQSSKVDDGSDQDVLEREMVLRSLEEYSQGGVTDEEDRVALIQVPHSKWEKEDCEEEEQDEDEVKVQTDLLEAFLLSPAASVTAAGRETEGEVEQERHGPVETGMEEDRAVERVREGENNSSAHGSHRSVAPSSGRDLSHRGRETEGRDRERKTERKRSRERTRDRDRRGDGERKSGHRRRRSPSSSRSYSDCKSRERRDAQKTKLPDKTHRDTLLDVKFKEKDLSHFCQNREAPSGTSRPHYSPSLPHNQGGENIVNKESRKPNKMDIVIKARTGMGEDDEMEGPGSCRDDGKKKPTTSRKEKRQRGFEEPPEEEERKRKSTKQSRQREEEESSGDVEGDETQLYSFLSC